MRILPQKIKKPDLILAGIVILLSLFGIVMISSSSMVISFERYGSNYHYVSSQAIYFLFGILAMIIFYCVDYRFWKKNAFWIFIVALILLILVFVPGIGHKFGGAQRWLGYGSFVFQPSEIIKLAFIIYLASWLEKRTNVIQSFFKGFLPFCILILLLGILIMNQPDLGTFSVITLTAVAMYFVTGANLKHLFLGIGSMIVVFLILIKTASYRMQRFLVFLNPSSDSQGAAYHINQALLAVGTGGLWGLGFGQSRQKYLYLPQPHIDSIFAVIAEELGFVRSLIVLAVFGFLFFKGFKIAKNAPDKFSSLLAFGITFWIMIQAFINIGSMLNLLPITGVPLPFISYGGTSLIVLLAASGILLNISKNSAKAKI